MGKRRRERDRPKDQPEGVYDPNKRVMLSYESDHDEGLGRFPSAIERPAIESQPSPPTFESSTNGDQLDANGLVQSADPESEKRCDRTKQRLNARVVSNTKKKQSNRAAYIHDDEPVGQRTIFGPGGLESGNQEWDQCYEDETLDAFAYLQAVR